MWVPLVIDRADGQAPSMERAFPFLVLGSFGPFVSALVVTGRTGGRAAVRSLLRRMRLVRVGWTPWLVALFGCVPGYVVAVIALDPSNTATFLGTLPATILTLPLLALFNIIGGPLGEEPGWRGVMLPRLLERMSPLNASLVVGIVWAVWHLPLMLTVRDFPSVDRGPVVWLVYPATLVGFSFVMTWLHLRGSASIAIAIAAHSALNTIAGGVSDLRDEGIVTDVREIVVIGAALLLTGVGGLIVLRTSRSAPAQHDVVSAGDEPLITGR